MAHQDRRIQKSQAAIKHAVLDLMAEKDFEEITIRAIADRANVNRGTVYLHYLDKFDILDKLIEEHMNKLRELCQSTSDLTFQEGNYVWFDYFETHHLFFSTMLTTKSADYFRSRFLELVVAEYQGEVDVSRERNLGLSEDVVLQFFGRAIVGAVEWWIRNGMPLPARDMGAQTGILLDRNL